VGKHLAEILAGEYKNIDILKKATKEELININEVGPKVAESIHDFFKSKIASICLKIYSKREL